MGTAADFSKALHEHAGAYAAWLPIANRFELGDYGIVTDGVFQRLGHISDFGVELQSDGPTPAAPVNFTAGETRVVKLVGGAEVQAFPETAADVSLRIEFGASASSMVKAAKVAVTDIDNLQGVAAGLGQANGWDRGWRVVRSLWRAERCAIAISSGKQAHFELSGKADAIKQLDLGSVHAGVTVSAQQNVGFSSVGGTGTIGLGLFKLKRFSGKTELLKDGEAAYELDEDDELESDL